MREGYRSVLEFLEADFEIEEEQEHLYNQLATASHDAKVKETFQHLARAAKGHKDAIGRIIRDIESDNHDVCFYCLMCGWEISFWKNALCRKRRTLFFVLSEICAGRRG